VPVLAVAGLAARLGWGLDQVQRVHVAGLPASDPLADGKPTTLLLMGTDHTIDDPSRAQVVGQRADTMLVVHVDPASGRVTMLSVPRDLWTGSGKLNGLSPTALVRWLADDFAVHVDHYLSIDMDGLVRLAALHPTRLRLDRPVRDRTSGLALGSGCQTVGGPPTLAYVRSRHLQELDGTGQWVDDTTGDLGREARTQAFIDVAWSGLAGLGPTDLPAVVDDLRANATVDDRLSNADLLHLGRIIAGSTTPATALLPVEPGTIPSAPGSSSGESVVVLAPGPLTDAAVASVGGRLNPAALSHPATTTANPPVLSAVSALGLVRPC
jgi:anionic cell wall polymer biosynthesis LytR-Cps2A-Psr (LCP) family protein